MVTRYLDVHSDALPKLQQIRHVGITRIAGSEQTFVKN